MMEQHPRHGQIGYLQLPARDVARSAAFYGTVFGWSVDHEHGSFEAPGMIGQWTTERAPAAAGGPVVWICADDLRPTLERAVAGGGTVQGRPRLDNGERWLVELDDPAGNRIGVVVPVRAPRPSP
jgi:predicted enzyme related to lactoylglutathione lyase